MKSARECIYITPCGFCKRKQKQCEEFEKEEKRIKEEIKKWNEKAPWE